jgi:AcrR family transcriptional regulator
MTEVAVHEGYAAASIARTIAQAGVSRPTFYEYFTDKDDCFLAALADSHQQLLPEIHQAIQNAPPEQAAQAAIAALIDFASSQPTRARFLLTEPMAAGPQALDARDRGITDIAHIIDEAHQQAPADAATPDLSSGMLIGGVYRLLASRLRRAAPDLDRLHQQLLHWIASYEQPAGKHRWSTLAPAPPVPPSPFLPETPLSPPQPLPPGRPRVTEQEVAENHRRRILFAAAEVAREKGYTASTVEDITHTAHVSRKAFYHLYADKQDAFMAVHELVLQNVVSVTAAAFFAGATWPERIWEGIRASLQFLQANPTIAYFGFVESYAVGPGAVQRIEDSHIGFTIFLQEGYQHQPREHDPSRLALEAIAVTQYELGYRQTRHDPTKLARYIPHLVHLALTPFLGPAETNKFIDAKMKG